MLARIFATLALVALLSGCAQPIVKTTGPLAIREVHVSAADTLKAETDVLSLVRQTVPSQLVGVHEGKTAKVDVTLVTLTYKNPVLSLLVGSSNQLGASVVLREANGAELSGFDVLAIDQGAINGIAGAVISVAQDKARVDRALARELAEQIERRIYGTQSREVMTPDLAAPAQPSSEKAVTQPQPRKAAPRELSGAGV